MASPVAAVLPAVAPPVVVVSQPAPLPGPTPPISGFIEIWGISINPSLCVLMLAAAWLGYFLWKAQRNNEQNSFNVWDLVQDIDPVTRERKTSLIKVTFTGCFILSSWVIIDNQIKGTLSEGIFGIYMSVWGLSLIAKVVFDKKDPPTLKMPGTSS